MKLKQVIQELAAIPLAVPENWETVTISDVFASDLISDILVSEGEDQLLLTSLTSPQVVRTAALVGAAAVVLVHRRRTPPELADAARAQELPLFRCTMTKYDACVRIGRLRDAS